MTARIATVRPTERGCEIAWAESGQRSDLPWLWLRELCLCAACYNAQTHQREVYTAGLPVDIAASEVSVAEEGEALTVTWSHDGHQSRYAAADLLGWVSKRGDAGIERRLWDASVARELPRLPMARFMADDDEALREGLEAIERYGFCFVHDVPPTLGDTRAVVERIGYIRETIFGGLWSFSAEAMVHSDSAYSTQALRPHTDGTYSLDAPGLQIFHCLEYEGQGGESILVDGFQIAERLRREQPEAFRVLASVEVTGQYIEPGVHLEASRPIFRLNQAGALLQVTFNNYDRAPLRLMNGQMEAFYDALRAFETLANDPSLQLKHLLQRDEVLLIDNWRVMHARAAYQGKRRMAGCYVNREDFESKLRVLRETRH